MSHLFILESSATNCVTCNYLRGFSYLFWSVKFNILDSLYFFLIETTVLLCASDALHVLSQGGCEGKIQVAWGVTSCQLRSNYHFREVCCLHVPRTLTGLTDPEERGSTDLQTVSSYF